VRPEILWHKIRGFRAASSAIAAYFGLRLLAVTCLGDDFYAQAEARRGALKAKKLPLLGIFLLAVPTEISRGDAPALTRAPSKMMIRMNGAEDWHENWQLAA